MHTWTVLSPTHLLPISYSLCLSYLSPTVPFSHLLLPLLSSRPSYHLLPSSPKDKRKTRKCLSAYHYFLCFFGPLDVFFSSFFLSPFKNCKACTNPAYTIRIRRIRKGLPQSYSPSSVSPFDTPFHRFTYCPRHCY